jgi:hypothetical protein
VNENLHLWNAVKQPPKSALKSINAGRLKGKSDINPQWRLQAMTEQFGPCGSGWKYTIDRLWTEPGTDGQVCAFALVSLYYKGVGLDEWSEAVQGIGGSMLIEQESKGLHTSDEAYKMAVTDALSVAMKALGVAADIYAGKWDGSKYAEEPSKETVNEDQAVTLAALIEEVKADGAKFSEFFGISRLGDLPASEYKRAVAMLEAKRGR